MSSKKLLTIFGATGNQGGSIISTVLSHPTLSQKYTLRGVSRDPSSSKAQALASKGVEIVKAELDDPASLRVACEGAYGVFGVTDFWSILSKEKEIQQGTNIFDAAKAAGVKHFVWSSLGSPKVISEGKFTRVDHFESKHEVEEYAEANKGEMICSYYQPAMFMNFAKQMVKPVNSTLTLALPFPSDNIDWPLIDPAADRGKDCMGLFEAGSSANSAHVNAAVWTTPKQVVADLSAEIGQEVAFAPIPAEVFQSFLPEAIAHELTENMQLVGEFEYYGKGSKEKQAENDKWIVESAGPNKTFAQWVKENGPWEF